LIDSTLLSFSSELNLKIFDRKASSITETISKIEGILHFNDEEEEEQLRMEFEKLGITNVFIEYILFSRLLGENVT